MHATTYEKVAIDLGDRSYEVVIGSGLLGRPESYAGIRGTDAFIVTDANVGPLYARRKGSGRSWRCCT